MKFENIAAKRKENEIELPLIRHIGSDEDMPYDLLLEAEPSRNLIDSYLSASEVYVAVTANNIIGICVLYPVSADIAEVKNISVREKYQGRGIGTLLLEFAAKRARERGQHTLILGTGNASFVPLYLYQKQGFEITHIIRDFFVDNYPEALFDHGIQVKHMVMLAKPL